MKIEFENSMLWSSIESISEELARAVKSMESFQVRRKATIISSSAITRELGITINFAPHKFPIEGLVPYHLQNQLDTFPKLFKQMLSELSNLVTYALNDPCNLSFHFTKQDIFEAYYEAFYALSITVEHPLSGKQERKEGASKQQRKRKE